MLKSRLPDNKSHSCVRDYNPEKIMRAMNDGRKRSRKAPVRHPWRRYRITESLKTG